MCASGRERVHCQSSKWTLVELTGTNLLSSLRGHRCLTAAIVAVLLSCCQCNWLAGSLGNTGTAVANIQGFQRDGGCHSPWMGRKWKSRAEQVDICACTHTHHAQHTHTHTLVFTIAGMCIWLHLREGPSCYSNTAHFLTQCYLRWEYINVVVVNHHFRIQNLCYTKNSMKGRV